MAHARSFWTSTLQDLFNGIKNTPMQGVLTPAIVVWVFGSPKGLQTPIFRSVSGDLTLPSKWGWDSCSSSKEAGAPPPSGFPHTMLNVKKVKDNMRLAFIEKFFYQLWDWDQRTDKILALQGYVVRERNLLVWHQLCSTTESSSLASMWQHAAWGSARCVEGRAIRREALSRLRLGEGRGWKTLVPCLSKYIES
jgi:hypothetical protein